MCLGRSKEPSHRDGSFEYPKYMLWPRNEKMRENLSLKFPKRVSSATVTSENLKHPLFGVVRQNFISVQLRECAGSSEPYLLQLCYIMRCPMWGEGKRVGERRIQFVLSSVQVVGLFITSGLRRLTSCL